MSLEVLLKKLIILSNNLYELRMQQYIFCTNLARSKIDRNYLELETACKIPLQHLDVGHLIFVCMYIQINAFLFK